MVIVEFDAVELDTCPDCRGLWFDAQELRQLFELSGTPEHLHDLENHLQRLTGPRSQRACPRCRGRLIQVRVPSADCELILDECRRGHGLWFDQGELETLLQSLLGEESPALKKVHGYLGQFVSADPGTE